MIDKRLQKYIEDDFKNQQGQDYPCSNQIVGNFIIIYKDDDYSQNFIKSLNGKCIRKLSVLSAGEKEIILPSGEHYNIIREIPDLYPNFRGIRFYKVYIDCRISERVLYEWILPKCCLYCCMLKFF